MRSKAQIRPSERADAAATGRPVRPREGSQPGPAVAHGRSAMPSVGLAATPRMSAQRSRLQAVFGNAVRRTVSAAATEVQGGEVIGVADAGRHSPTTQRVVTSAAVGGAIAPLTNAALIAHIDANSSPVIKEVAQHANVDLRVTWDGTPGAAIDTAMRIQWNDGAAHGPHDMFDPVTIPLVQAMDFQNLLTYGIEIRIGIPIPPPAGTTSRGNLLHELEAHVRLAKTVTGIIDETWASVGSTRPTTANAPAKIGTTMHARSEDAEHKMLASGGGGSEDAMTRTVLSAPRVQAVAVLADIANDRALHLQLADATEHYARIDFNGILNGIARWAETTSAHVPDLTVAEQGIVSGVIAGIRQQRV